MKHRPTSNRLARKMIAGFAVMLTTSTLYTQANDWYQWRGPNRDGIAKESKLLDQWPESGPEIAYRTKGLGSGMASVAIYGGLLYSIGNTDGQTTLHCLNQADGSVAWKTPFTPDKGAANGTPTFDPETGLVYALSFDIKNQAKSSGQAKPLQESQPTENYVETKGPVTPPSSSRMPLAENNTYNLSVTGSSATTQNPVNSSGTTTELQTPPPISQHRSSTVTSSSARPVTTMGEPLC